MTRLVVHTAKHFSIKGLAFKTYSKLYDSTVVPIADYAAGVWGFRPYGSMDKLQHKALRTFLGCREADPFIGDRRRLRLDVSTYP